MRVLLTGPGYTDEHVRSLERQGWSVAQHDAIDGAELDKLLPELDAYVLGGDERLDARRLELAVNLRAVSFVGTGYGDFVDGTAADRLDIEIRSTPGVGSPAVAEHTVGMLLGLVRGLYAHNDTVKRGGAAVGPTVELSQLTVGIVGLGDIGTRVARILRTAFNAPVLYASRSRKPDLESELGLGFRPLIGLCGEADVVVTLALTSEETAGLLGPEAFAAMRLGTFLVNTAGARLVDPAALRGAIEDGTVAAAAFDSYWIEPPPAPADDPYGLLALGDDRFVVTPHVAAKTTGTWTRMVDQAVANVADLVVHAR